MKRLLTSLLVISSLFLPLTLWAAITPLPTAETYTIDPNHSYVLWRINHFGFSNPSGKWFANGVLTLDEQHPQNSKVKVTINVTEMHTGLPKLGDHLRSKEFFDVAQYPTATFVSDKIEVTGKKTANVHGILTLHGVSKPITLNVTLNKIGDSPITHKKTAGFSATTELKRSEFGINAYLPGLSDEVKLMIEAEAVQGQEAG